jgi:hypothetical protein
LFFKPFLALFSEVFSSFLAQFRAGRHENKEKRLFYFALGILLSIQIQLLDTEKPKKSKSRLPLMPMFKRDQNGD